MLVSESPALTLCHETLPLPPNDLRTVDLSRMALIQVARHAQRLGVLAEAFEEAMQVTPRIAAKIRHIAEGASKIMLCRRSTVSREIRHYIRNACAVCAWQLRQPDH
jgi:hypothetical protein